MTRITVDATTAAKLHGLGEHLEICDESGNILGHFAPAEGSPAFQEWLRNQDSGLTKDEIRRRVASRDGLSTDEVLARLRGRNP